MSRNLLQTSMSPRFVPQAILAALLASFGLVAPATAATYFFKVGDMVTVWTSDYTSDGTYFIWETRNVKNRLKMCRDQFGYNGTVIEHVRFKNDPYVNASSFAIVSEGQVFPFPMPTYQNGNPRIPAGEHLSMIPQPYNEITWKDVSATSASGEMEIEATWTTLDGSPKRKNLTGRDEIGAFYKKIGEILAVLPADAAPSFIDLFDGEQMLLTKGNLRSMQHDITELIRKWKANQANAETPVNAPSESPSSVQSSPETFVANGPQGEASFDFTKNGGVFTIKNGVDAFHTKWGRRSMYQVNAAAGMAGKIGGQSGLTTLPSLSAAKLMDYSKPSRVVGEGEVVVFRNVQGKYVAVKLMRVDDAVSGGSQNKLTIRWKVLQP